MKNEKLFGLLIASALVSSTVALAEGGAPAADAKKGDSGYCQNNSCKGKSACKGHGNDSCSGQNSCKGHGFLKSADAKACKKDGGKWKAEKS